MSTSESSQIAALSFFRKSKRSPIEGFSSLANKTLSLFAADRRANGKDEPARDSLLDFLGAAQASIWAMAETAGIDVGVSGRAFLADPADVFEKKLSPSSRLKKSNPVKNVSLPPPSPAPLALLVPEMRVVAGKAVVVRKVAESSPNPVAPPEVSVPAADISSASSVSHKHEVLKQVSVIPAKTVVVRLADKMRGTVIHSTPTFTRVKWPDGREYRVRTAALREPLKYKFA